VPLDANDRAVCDGETEGFVRVHVKRGTDQPLGATIVASHAGAKGGFGALSLAKQAKQALEHALALDAKALEGSAYTSLGSLYYQVPGWPIGFGDDRKAREFLQQALALNPDGIDPNFFLGDYLYRKGDYAGARQALETPRGQGSRAFWAAAFPQHPAGRPAGGTAQRGARLSAVPLAP